MKPILSCEEVRRLEDCIESEGTSKATLMELAGEFAASVVAASDPKRVLILVGFGNNGGDGWVAADILANKGITVDVVSPVEPDEIPAALARHVARRTAGRDVNIVIGPSRDELAELVSRADVVVDAILGTGFHGSLRPPFSIWIPTVNELAAEVVAIDVPSGLDAETGLVEEDAIRAARTARITPARSSAASSTSAWTRSSMTSTMRRRWWSPSTSSISSSRCRRISISTRADRCSSSRARAAIPAPR